LSSSLKDKLKVSNIISYATMFTWPLVFLVASSNVSKKSLKVQKDNKNWKSLILALHAIDKV
jgi:hypothetical protein